MAAANLRFDGREELLDAIHFFGGGQNGGDTLIDDLSADPDNMLFPDTDKDGLPNDWETANGSNPNLYDRDEVQANGKSWLEQYVESLWNGNGGVFGGPSQGGAGGGSIPPLTIQGLHQPVGALKGALTVGGDGSAAYSVPIDIPKGTAGMEPQISLNYSSNGGNGLFGLGWSLGGLQRITRGPMTVAKNGIYDPVNFDSLDRFFLDGERLICIGGGDYGDAGTEYRTEIDSFGRITYQGANGGWTVETKAGLKVELGKTSDSRDTAPGGVLSWGVSKVSDTVGNYYLVEYARDTNPGPEFHFTNSRPSAIHYTGGQGLAPYCHIEFSYESRPDVSRAFTPNAGYYVDKRLTEILVRTDTYINHTYRLIYETSYQTGRSLMVELQKFAGSGTVLDIPSSRFSYQGLSGETEEERELWSAPVGGVFSEYGNNWDATSLNNSSVTLEEGGAAIRLRGDVSRVVELPQSVNLTSAT